MSEPVKIFVSYAHEDEEHKDVLRKQLAGLIRSEQIDLWDDRNLTAGDDWEAEILTRVEGCDVAIFLVSAAFLASEFINAKEYARMIERHEAGEARIFPIILRPSAWKPTEIGKIQVVPKDGKAVVTFSPENGERDQVWLDVTTALQTLLQSMGEKQADAPKPDAPKDTPSAPATLTQRLPRGQSRVLRALMQGRAAFFLGDDVNRKPEAGERAQVPRADGQGPINAALAQHLATMADAPINSGASLAHTAQMVAVRDGIAPVLDDLHAALDQDFQVGPTHMALAQLGRALCRPGGESPIFLSVNFDDMMERAFDAIGQEIDILSYAVTSDQQCMFRHVKPDGTTVVLDRPNEYTSLGLSERPLLVKLAGTVDRRDMGIEHFVVTEDDHFSFVAGRDIRQLLPPALMTRLLRSHYLFLGHSLSHWTLRALVSRVLGTGKMQARSWAVSDGLDELEECFWRVRDVEALDTPLAPYLQSLADALSHETAA